MLIFAAANTFLGGTPTQMFSCGICEMFRNIYLFLGTPIFSPMFRNTYFFIWTSLFDNLHFWMKLVPVLSFLYHNLQFRLRILPSLLLILDTAITRSSSRRSVVFYKIDVLTNFSVLQFHKILHKNTCVRVSILIKLPIYRV